MKKMVFASIIVACFLFFVPLSSFGGNQSYSCKINNVYVLDARGSLKPSNWEKEFKGSVFSISRDNGEIIGEVLPTKLARSTKVIHKGNKEFSFKAIAYFQNQVQLIEIEEFQETKEKPFVAISTGGAEIVTGVCK